jgi:signal peptidase I
MSLEISLRDKETDEVVMSLNWLRNPFGLEQWAELNVGETGNSQKEERLWYVCNNWNYDRSKEIDKQLFKNVVDSYWVVLKNLGVGYFVFTLPEYRQFVEGLMGRNLEMKDYHYQKNHTEIAINMECFKNDPSLDTPSLEKYKEWFHRLVVFAEKLQEPCMEFHCSN